MGSDHKYATWISAKAGARVSSDPRLAESFSGTIIRLQLRTNTQTRRKEKVVNRTKKILSLESRITALQVYASTNRVAVYIHICPGS